MCMSVAMLSCRNQYHRRWQPFAFNPIPRADFITILIQFMCVKGNDRFSETELLVPKGCFQTNHIYFGLQLTIKLLAKWKPPRKKKTHLAYQQSHALYWADHDLQARWGEIFWSTVAQGSKSVLILLHRKAANLPSDITSFLFWEECCNLKRSVRMKTLIPKAWCSWILME